MVPPAVIESAITPAPAPADKLHPLLPLTADEIRLAAHLTRYYFGNDSEELRFNSISLLEEPIHTPEDENALDRLAHVVVQQPEKAAAHELHISLKNESVIWKNALGRVQPPLSPEDCLLAESIVKSDARVLDLLRTRYGIENAANFRGDPWSVHVADEEAPELSWRKDGKPTRLVQTFLYAVDDMKDNQYAHPIDIVPVVDLYAKCVVRVFGESRPPVPVPSTAVNYHRDKIAENEYLPTTFRKKLLKPLHVVQPNGPSFDVVGNSVSWQHWSFFVGFNYREGLVLHDISYDGRPVLDRASLVEMAVPYFDPSHPFTQKCAFDVGDYGLGYFAMPLSLGCDCLGTIHYFDAILSDSKGEPYKMEKAVCMHEEDTGLAWKHVDYVTMHNESRRARRLVVSFIATVVNYEYLFYWYFNIDGSIEFEIKLSGELSTNVQSEGEETPLHGTLVAPGVNAQLHQHMFCVRLDPAIDGPLCAVDEVELQRIPVSERNLRANAVRVVATRLRTERDGARDAAPGRTWRISNASGAMNQITGRPTAYRLTPGTRGGMQPPLLVGEDCMVSRRGTFATRALWVTRRDAAQRFPAGEFPTQSVGGEGVAEWVKMERDIDGTPLSIWHAFGVAHVPRVEDFPVMPCESVGFSLKPDGFFLGNPALDLPPERDARSVQVGNGAACGTACGDACA